MCYLEKLFGELMKERALRLNNFEDNYKTKATGDGSHHTRSDAAVRIETRRTPDENICENIKGCFS